MRDQEATKELFKATDPSGSVITLDEYRESDWSRELVLSCKNPSGDSTISWIKGPTRAKAIIKELRDETEKCFLDLKNNPNAEFGYQAPRHDNPRDELLFYALLVYVPSEDVTEQNRCVRYCDAEIQAPETLYALADAIENYIDNRT